MFVRHSQQSMPSNRSRQSGGGPDEVSPEFPQRQTTPGPDDVYDSGGCGRGQSSGPYYYDSNGGGDSYVGSTFLG